MLEKKQKIIIAVIAIIFFSLAGFTIYFFLPKEFKSCSNLPKGENYCDFYKCSRGIPYAIGIAPEGYADYMDCWGGVVIDAYENKVD
jgi:hypothetical protein